MVGGTSHVESFDPKPMLDKYDGKTIEETPFKGRSIRRISRRISASSSPVCTKFDRN